MATAPSLPTVEELGLTWSSGLGGAAGTPLSGLFVSRLDSTQRLAKTLLDQCVHEDEGPLPFVVVALEQTAGRGRQGRDWWSPAGSGLYASLVIPIAGSERLQELPIRTAAALGEFVNGLLGGAGAAVPSAAADPVCRVKWPNDLMVGHAKLGGILVDAVTPPAPAESWAIVGFGLNYATPDPRAIPDATSMVEESARSVAVLPGFESFVVGAISAVYRAATSDEPGWAERYSRLSAHRDGDTIRFRLGGEEGEGKFRGFDEHGFLRLETAAGTRLIRSGEIYSW